jgi:hypothetical protein
MYKACSYSRKRGCRALHDPHLAGGHRVFDFGPNTDIWRFERLCRDNESERIFWCGQFGRNARTRQDLVRTQVRRVATPGKLLRSIQITHLSRARDFLGLQSSRLQSSNEEYHRDSMMTEANSSI